LQNFFDFFHHLKPVVIKHLWLFFRRSMKQPLAG